ncbi:MAG: ATP-grasp domain-containing protein [Pseudonocardia sediminis]
MNDRPRVLLVHQRTTLPWIFDAAVRAGVDLVLVPRPDEQLGDDLPAGVTEVLAVDTGAPDALAVVAAEHARRPFDGVMTLYDAAVGFAAAVAHELGLPGPGPEVAERVRDKRVMRERLRAAGLNSPRFVALDGPQDWRRATGVACPVVVKPSDGLSSAGVTRVDDPATLEAVVAEVWRVSGAVVDRRSGSPGLVVEEFLDGPELAVESLAHDGDVRVLSIGYKGEPVGPHFEEGLYEAPARLPSEVRDAVEREVVAAHAALGLRDGPAHTELRLRGGTVPYVLELGARIGGSGVSHHVVEAVTGIDFAADALRIAIGRAPECFASPVTVRGAGGNYIVPCGGQGRIVALDGLDDVAAAPEVTHLVQMLFPGDVVRPYPEFTGYPAFVLSRHAGIDELERFHSGLGERISIRYRPEAATAGAGR